MTKKFALVFIGILIVVISLFTYLYNTQPLVKLTQNLYIPKCNKYDIDLEIPNLMKTSIIRFEKPVYIKTGSTANAKKGCPGILQEAQGYIDFPIHPELVSTNNTNFVVLKHEFIKCHSVIDNGCFENIPGEYYLLQDTSTGNKYLFRGYFSEKIAGYYDKNNPTKRIGDVVTKDYFQSCVFENCHKL